MVSLHQLPKIIARKKKRLGQGHGSGRGKTAGRGTKGQKSRGKTPTTLGERGANYLRRLPLYRGKFRNKPTGKKPLIVNLKDLNVLPKGTIVDRETLVKHAILPKDIRERSIKILGDGEVTIPLTITLPCSKSAAAKIEKAGGRIEYKSTNQPIIF